MTLDELDAELCDSMMLDEELDDDELDELDAELLLLLLDTLWLDTLAELSLEYSSGDSRLKPSHHNRPRKPALPGKRPNL